MTMPAYDIFHGAVRNGLIKDRWTITDDPLIVYDPESEVVVRWLE
jgi:hypothetical protein